MNDRVTNLQLTVSATVLALIGLVLVALGIFLILVRPSFVLLPEDIRFTQLSPEQLRLMNGHLFDWIGLVFRSWGAFMAGFGTLISFTAWGAYRRGDRSAWLTLAVGGIVPLSIFLLVNLALGSDFRWLIALMLVAYVGALLLPIRQFRRKSSDPPLQG
jgi:hypothetical protein